MAKGSSCCGGMDYESVGQFTNEDLEKKTISELDPWSCCCSYCCCSCCACGRRCGVKTILVWGIVSAGFNVATAFMYIIDDSIMDATGLGWYLLAVSIPLLLEFIWIYVKLE